MPQNEEVISLNVWDEEPATLNLSVAVDEDIERLRQAFLNARRHLSEPEPEPEPEREPEPSTERSMFCYRCEEAHLPGVHTLVYCGRCNDRHRVGEHFPYCAGCECHVREGHVCNGPYCSGCDMYHTGDRCVWCEDCDTYHGPPSCAPSGGCSCSECRPPNRYRRRLIHNYGYSPDPRFMGEGPLYFGMELEIEIRNSFGIEAAADQVQHTVGGLGYLKEDGSIGNGFELCTHPMTWEYFTSEFPTIQLAETLQDVGGYDTRETGIHVHASRAGFEGPSHVYRWLKLWYRNADKIQRMARRSDSSWASFRPQDRAMCKFYAKGYPVEHRGFRQRDYDEIRDMARELTGYSDDSMFNRYSAINVSSGHGTYEARVFRSSTKPQQIQAAVGLVSASIEYTRKLSSRAIAQEKGWAWRTFSQWVKDHPQYEILYKEMRDRRCVS